jgi:hypothetical protein
MTCVRGVAVIPHRPWRRRELLLVATAMLPLPARSIAAVTRYPTSVAGIRLPDTGLCRDAYDLCHSSTPPFLLNHSLRTYVFGALHAAHHRQSFHAETAFTAAILHDIGLMPAFASPKGSFEIDGADRAEQFARQQGGSASESARVWNAIVMHDMRFAIPAHQSAEATLVAAGAAADVIGPDEAMFDRSAVDEVVAAFPRLQFKQQFIALLADHCARKPGAQSGTWLDGFCRVHSTVAADVTGQAILRAPFAE